MSVSANNGVPEPGPTIELPPKPNLTLETPAEFKEGCFGIRSEIELIKSFVVNWMQHPELKELCFTEAVLDKKTEIYSNLKLAYRHLEDARMRIGKAVQAWDGGKSCYDK